MATPNSNRRPRPARRDVSSTTSLLAGVGQTLRRGLRRVALTRIPLPPSDNTKDIARHPAFIGPISRGLWKLFNVRVTRAGRWFFGLTFALSIFGATTLEVQTYIPLLYCVALWAVASLASWFVKPRVGVTTRHAARVRAGQTLTVTVQVSNRTRRSLLDLYLLPSRLPLAIDSDPPGGVSVGTLLPGASRTVVIGLRAMTRGAYTLRGWRVETDFPFGLLNAYREYPQQTELLVHPAYTPLTRLDLPTGRRMQPGGIALASRMGDSMEYLGNREFREGDPIRDIDWRATARMGGMPVVREWREEHVKRLGLVLDTSVPPGLRPRERAQRLAALERAVSLTTAISEQLASQDCVVELLAEGPNLHRLTAGRSLGNQDQILDILARLEPGSGEPLPTVTPQIEKYLEQLTTVVCVFLSWNQARQAFVDDMRGSGAAVKIILVTTEGDDLNDMPTERELIVISPDNFAAGVTLL